MCCWRASSSIQSDLKFVSLFNVCVVYVMKLLGQWNSPPSSIMDVSRYFPLFVWHQAIWEEEAQLSDTDIEELVSEVEVKKDRLFGGHSSYIINKRKYIAWQQVADPGNQVKGVVHQKLKIHTLYSPHYADGGVGEVFESRGWGSGVNRHNTIEVNVFQNVKKQQKKLNVSILLLWCHLSPIKYDSKQCNLHVFSLAVFSLTRF